ncbi:MAG TPA: hypothetical protein VN203_16285, partial [Candidatus Acidoferrum sp.]|nr:hypothetical protein [Candidatus Acidoferrum sp.]
MNRFEHDTPGSWHSLLDLPPGHYSTWKQGVKAGNLVGKRASLPLRFGVRHLLGAIVLASLMCMAVRSLFLMEALGILLWPVLPGFGTDRMAGRAGILGGTTGGLFSVRGSLRDRLLGTALTRDGACRSLVPARRRSLPGRGWLLGFLSGRLGLSGRGNHSSVFLIVRSS